MFRLRQTARPHARVWLFASFEDFRRAICVPKQKRLARWQVIEFTANEGSGDGGPRQRDLQGVPQGRVLPDAAGGGWSGVCGCHGHWGRGSPGSGREGGTRQEGAFMIAREGRPRVIGRHAVGELAAAWPGAVSAGEGSWDDAGQSRRVPEADHTCVAFYSTASLSDES